MGRDETKSIAISMVNGTMYYDVGVVVGVGVGVGVEGIDRVSRCLLAVVLCVFFLWSFRLSVLPVALALHCTCTLTIISITSISTTTVCICIFLSS